MHIFVTKFVGAKSWIENHGPKDVQVVDELDIDAVEKGDTVIGNLTVEAIAEINQAGAFYQHFTLGRTPTIPDSEMTALEIEKHSPMIRRFFVSTPLFSLVESEVGEWDPVNGEYGPEMVYDIHSKITSQGALLRVSGEGKPTRDVYLERIEGGWRINISMNLNDVDADVVLRDDGSINFSEYNMPGEAIA